MSPEEMQRAMQFLLNQQAQFAADLTRQRELFAADMETLSAKTDRIADGLIGVTSIVGQLASAQLRTDEQLRQSDLHIDRVESHLNVLIEMFERHLREDHGRPPS